LKTGKNHGKKQVEIPGLWQGAMRERDLVLSYTGTFHQNETPMNLKPNLWTLLFVLAAGVLAYQQLSSKSNTETAGVIPASAIAAGSDSIPSRAAVEMIATYMERYQRVLSDPNAKINGRTVLDTTGVVAIPIYFKLERNEIAEIFRHFGGQQVYAVLGLLPGANGARDTIDLILSDVEPNKGNIFLQGTFYDFATPCPPLCDE
jgi:hypothetical protein